MSNVVINGHEKDLGSFSVRRLLPFQSKRSVGPFVFFDHMGPAQLTMENGMAVRPHPHIGLSTVTYLFEGCIMHRDSLGTKQPIFPGEVNWMTAGKGIVHSERTPKEPENFKDRMEGLQIWIALPKEFEEVEPSFINFPSTALPNFKVNEADITLILGEAFNHKSPVPIYSKLFYLDVKLQSGNNLSLMFNEKEEFAIYIISGKLKIKDETYNPYQMITFSQGESVIAEATEDTRFVVIGGEPLSEPRYMWWNFVSSSKERIERAKYDWINNNFDKVPDETEFIPLPEDGYPVLYP